MKKRTHLVISTLIGIALLVAGIVGASLFVKNKPKAQRRHSMSSMIPVVETIQLSISDQPLQVNCLGTVISDKSASIQAEVSGRIVAIATNLVEGELIKKGDLLIEIEDGDYQLTLAQTEVNLLTAQSNLRIEEGQQDVVRNELKLMDNNESDSYRDLMLREPQLKVAEASVKSAEIAIASAQLNLDRTKICAPFDAVIVTSNADIGDYAQPSKILLELAATDRYFIRASIPLSALEPLPKLGKQPYSAKVTLPDGSIRAAKTHRLLPDLTDKGRMARLLLTVDAPYDDSQRRPLLLNEVVRLEITGETAANASLIPRKYLRDGNFVWMIDSDNKLHVLPVEILQGYADDILIRIEPDSGMELITTDLAASIDGMQLRRINDHATKKIKKGKNSAPKDQRQQKQGA